ncbi:hypothetical protein [Flavobacterium sp.]|uniref:hypothetical protein n=1 Tax=Flavobacterium sp. TaxID=239 RepID=UPI0037BFAB74
MSSVEIIAIVVTLAAAFVGVAALVFLVGQRPAFWVGMAIAVFQRAWPVILGFVMRRMPPEEEAAWREAERQGQGDEFMRRRRGAPPKG